MISGGVCVHAKVDFLSGVHQPGDTYKLALYGRDAELSYLTTTEYTTAGEIRAPGYAAGGRVLQGLEIKLDGLTAVFGWTDDPVWKNATIETYGGLIYNASKGGRALVVADFAGKMVSTNGNFRVHMPPVDSLNASVRMGG